MNILIIEDSEITATVVEKTLTSYGYNVQTADSTTNIKSQLTNTPFDLMIIDTRLRLKDSYKICKDTRDQFPLLLIIAINSKGTWQDKVEILNKGADDCLSFPFPGQELLARIQALLRRPKLSLATNLQYGNIEINPSLMRATYRRKHIPLTKREFHLLEYMVRNKDRAIPRAELLDHVWDYRRVTGSNTVDVHVQKIRSKLKKCHANYKIPRPKKIQVMETGIQTVHGVGYRLDDSIKHPYNNKNVDEEITPSDL